MIRKEAYGWRPAKGKPLTQADMILSDLRKGVKLTPIDALENYGCFRLGARIYDLKREGHPIKSERVTDRESGKTYARYWL